MGKRTRGKSKSKDMKKKAPQKRRGRATPRKKKDDFDQLVVLLSRDPENGQYCAHTPQFPSMTQLGDSPTECLGNLAWVLEQAVEVIQLSE